MRINIKKDLFMCYVLLVLFLPEGIRDITTIYQVFASDFVLIYPWLSYRLSALEIPCIIASLLFCRKSSKLIDIRPVFALIVIKELIRVFVGVTSVFSFNDYSMLLGFLVGAGCYYLLVNNCGYNESDMLEIVIVLNFLFQIVFAFTGRVMTDGRYATLGSGVGEIGSFCAQFFLYYLFVRKKEKHSIVLLICCLGSLIISASRTNILLSLAFILMFANKLKGGFERNQKTKFIVSSFLIATIFCMPVFLFISTSQTSIFGDVLSRVSNTFQSLLTSNASNLTSDSSFLDRIQSINAGLGILSHNPLGISASTIDLQLQTIENGYYYFPHTSILCYYLLWGIAGLIVFVYIAKLFVEAIKQNNSVWIIILYILLTSVFYGGPIINCKTYFWYLCLFTVFKKELGISNNYIHRKSVYYD